MKEHHQGWLTRNGYSADISENTWTKHTKIGCMNCKRSGLKPTIKITLDPETEQYTMALMAENRHGKWVEISVSGDIDILKSGIETEMRLVGAWREFC